jgi:hypothetical protein
MSKQEENRIMSPLSQIFLTEPVDEIVENSLLEICRKQTKKLSPTFIPNRYLNAGYFTRFDLML